MISEVQLKYQKALQSQNEHFLHVLHLTWKPPHVFIVLAATRSISVISAKSHK